MLLFGVCEPLRDFPQVHSRSRDRPFIWNKLLEVAWVGPKVRRCGVSENLMDGATCVIQVDVACIFKLERRRAQQRNNGFCLHLRSGANHPSSPHPEARQLSAPRMSLVPLEQLSQHWSWERVSPSVSKAGHGPFKRKVSTSHNPHFTQVQPQLVFTAKGSQDFSSWHWNPGLGSPVCSQDPSLLRWWR